MVVQLGLEMDGYVIDGQPYWKNSKGEVVLYKTLILQNPSIRGRSPTLQEIDITTPTIISEENLRPILKQRSRDVIE